MNKQLLIIMAFLSSGVYGSELNRKESVIRAWLVDVWIQNVGGFDPIPNVVQSASRAAAPAPWNRVRPLAEILLNAEENRRNEEDRRDEVAGRDEAAGRVEADRRFKAACQAQAARVAEMADASGFWY